MENNNLRKVSMVIGWVMLPIYLGIGLALMFTSAFSELIPNNRLAIGCIFLIYGGFRGYMTWRLSKKNNPSES